MNIFKALSQGDGSINETNVTSFLSYILNETNEFSSSLMILLLELIEKEMDTNINDILNITEENYRQKINNFTNKYKYTAEPECRLQGNKLIQYVDILVTISEKTNDNVCCYILIENKIKKSSVNQQQCLEQYLAFKGDEDFQENVPIFSVLISPNHESFKVMIENVKKENKISVWLKWESKTGVSMVNLFVKLIKLENNSEISPIENNAQFIIKSFIDYISTELTIKEKTMNYSVTGFKIVEQASYQLNNNNFSLKRYDNNMIRNYDENGSLIKEQVKPVLREIIKKYNLNVNLERKPGELKTVQTLGRDVIRELNKF